MLSEAVLITEFALGSNGTYTSGSVSFTPNGAAATPQAIAIDAKGNLYVYDSTSKAIYRQSKSTAGTLTSVIASGFDNVVSLALDSVGNLYVSDTGTQAIYAINASGVQTTLATNVSAVSLSVDSAGDLYAANTLTGSIIEYPVSGPKTALGVSLTDSGRRGGRSTRKRICCRYNADWIAFDSAEHYRIELRHEHNDYADWNHHQRRQHRGERSRADRLDRRHPRSRFK